MEVVDRTPGFLHANDVDPTFVRRGDDFAYFVEESISLGRNGMVSR